MDWFRARGLGCLKYPMTGRIPFYYEFLHGICIFKSFLRLLACNACSRHTLGQSVRVISHPRDEVWSRSSEIPKFKTVVA